MTVQEILELLKERAELHGAMVRKHPQGSKSRAFHQGADTALTSVIATIKAILSK